MQSDLNLSNYLVIALGLGGIGYITGMYRNLSLRSLNTWKQNKRYGCGNTENYYGISLAAI